MTSSLRFSDCEQQSWLFAAIDAAREAGRILQDWQGRFSVREKSRSNLVTEADEASQAAIVKSLQERFPSHGFLGEEGLGRRPQESEVFWIIDPLDGTTNYVHGFPYYCISIALCVEDRISIGVIYDPSRDELFTSVLGGGADLNGRKITTSAIETLEAAMAMASLPVAADPEDPAVKRFLSALGKLQTVQRTGSAALNLAGVACGRIDAFWSSSLHVWDVAAGSLIVSEAGGSVTNLEGETFDSFVPSLLAASTVKLCGKLVTALR